MRDAGRELDVMYRLSGLLAGGTSCPSFLRAVLREAMALTHSRGGRVLVLERERRTLRSTVDEGEGLPNRAEVPVDDPPWGDAVREGRAVRMPPGVDAGRAPQLSIGHELVLPLLAQGDVLGVLLLEGLPSQWTCAPQTGVFLETLAGLAAHALQNAALQRDLVQQREELRTLVDVGQDIAASLELDEVLKRVVRQAARLMRAKACSLMLIDATEPILHIRATYGASQTYVQRSPLQCEASLIGEVVRTGVPIAVPDVREAPQYQSVEMARAEGLCSLLCVPMHINTRVIGVLNVYTAERRRFREAEVEFLSALAAQSATAIENARLYWTMLETQEQLRQSERLAALGRMSAGLAHEIRNPLNTMQLLVYAMQKDCPPPDPLSADLKIIQDEVGRLTLLVDQCLDFARPRLPEMVPQKLQEIMEETLLFVSAEAKRRGIRLRKSWPRELPLVWVDGAQIKQVFLNVLLNALQAMGPGGRIDVRIEAADGTITAVIRDEGEGIPPEVRAHLFTPFFTTKPDGTGLGLSIAQRIIEGHRGCIRVISERGAGTTVRIELPVRGEKPHANDPGRG